MCWARGLNIIVVSIFPCLELIDLVQVRIEDEINTLTISVHHFFKKCEIVSGIDRIDGYRFQSSIKILHRLAFFFLILIIDFLIIWEQRPVQAHWLDIIFNLFNNGIILPFFLDFNKDLFIFFKIRNVKYKIT